MDDADSFELPISPERQSEMRARFEAPPSDQALRVEISFDEDAQLQWLADKYRAYYEMVMPLGPNDIGDDLEISKKMRESLRQDRDLFADVVAIKAAFFFRKLVKDGLRAAIQAAVTEMEKNSDAMVQSAFNSAFNADFKPQWLTRQEKMDAWKHALRSQVDPQFITETRGGDRKSGKQLSGQKMLKFARRVDALRPAWRFAISFFDEQGHDSDCLDNLKRDERFVEITRSCGELPATMIKDAFNRNCHRGEGGKIPRAYSPSGFALRQAADEMGIPSEVDNFEALRKLYGEASRQSARPSG